MLIDWTTSKTMNMKYSLNMNYSYEIFGSKAEVTCMADMRAAPSHSSSQGVAEGPYFFFNDI